MGDIGLLPDSGVALRSRMSIGSLALALNSGEMNWRVRTLYLRDGALEIEAISNTHAIDAGAIKNVTSRLVKDKQQKLMLRMIGMS